MDSAVTLKWVHDRALTITVLALPVALVWAYVLLGTQRTIAMPSDWSLEYAATVLIMWAVMMVAMMLPSAAKAVLLAATLDDQHRSLLAVHRAGMFASGYLGVWLAFSLAATAAQWTLDEAGLLSPSMLISNATLAGSLLLYAGIYQWTPLKQTCLIHCRDPQEFLARHWRRDGPFGTGLRHGLFCFGCCWMLMVLLFVGGLMNLACIAVVAFAILTEKTLPLGTWTSRATGTALIAGGALMLATPTKDTPLGFGSYSQPLITTRVTTRTNAIAKVPSVKGAMASSLPPPANPVRACGRTEATKASVYG